MPEKGRGPLNREKSETLASEQKRLAEARERRVAWKKWGPYLSERQWGTVREDYSENGDAWNFFTGVLLVKARCGKTARRV